MDYFLLNWIQGFTPKSWDWFFSWFSLLGRFEIITLAVILFLWLLYRRIDLVFFGLFWYGLGLVLELVSKNWFPHQPPPLVLNRTVEIITLPGIRVASDFSFPSGHVYRMMFLTLLSTVYFLKTKNYLGVMVSCLLLLVMLYSRVSLAEHWPSDVIGGMLLATIMVKATFSSINNILGHNFIHDNFTIHN